jgi:hypothetical protein
MLLARLMLAFTVVFRRGSMRFGSIFRAGPLADVLLLA